MEIITDETQMNAPKGNGPKWLWVPIILIVLFVGAVTVYYLFGPGAVKVGTQNSSTGNEAQTSTTAAGQNYSASTGTTTSDIEGDLDGIDANVKAAEAEDNSAGSVLNEEPANLVY